MLQHIGKDAKHSLKGNLYGIDKDEYLSKLAKTHIALLTLSSGYIQCADSLSWRNINNEPLDLVDHSYDIVLTNPPFGKKIVSTSKEIQKTYELGYAWKLDKKSGRYIKTNILQKTYLLKSYLWKNV